MALQGDLKSFALPDVLRLLAGAAKSGHLEVAGVTGAGEVILCRGAIASATTDLAPRAIEPSDVVYELLRLEDGSFAFDEVEITDPGWQADVDATISTAEALADEWAVIEAVVPSMEAWLSLATELVVDEVLVTAQHWQVVAAIGGGGTVRDVAIALGLTDLAASRLIVDVVEAGLATVRAMAGYQPPHVELDDFEEFEDPMTDLHDLSAEDRPVVMEDREDALLPEPLPGEGVSYDGGTITGAVDGRAFDPESFEPTDEHSRIDGTNADFAQFDSLAAFEAAAAMSERAGEPGTIDGFAEVAAPAADGAETMDVLAASDQTSPVDTERDSLLKFLSSVKP